MTRSEKPGVRTERTEGEVGELTEAVLVVDEEDTGGGDTVKAKVDMVKEGRDSSAGEDTIGAGALEALAVDTGAEGVMVRVRLNPRRAHNSDQGAAEEAVKPLDRASRRVGSMRHRSRRDGKR